MRTDTPGYIVGDVLCLVAAILIAIQVIRKPKKLRIFIGFFAVLTLPCSIVNTLTYQGIVADRWNTLSYLISTFLMLMMHLYLIMDIGYQLHGTKDIWSQGLVLTAIALLFGSDICIVVQVAFLGAHPSDPFPFRPAFITGVCLAIFSNCAAFFYAFSPLIRWRKRNRTQEAHSKTTAYGVGF